MRKIGSASPLLERVFSNRLFLALWVFGCILLGIRLIHSGLGTKQAFFAQQQAQDRLKVEEDKDLDLIKKLDEADSALSQEKRIRNELNMQKPGEIILQLPSPSPKP